MERNEIAGMLELFSEVQAAFDEKKACEIADHNEMNYYGRYHSGDADWYLIHCCTHCGASGSVAICDSWKQHLEIPQWVRCLKCDKNVNNQWPGVHRYERINP